MKKINKIIYWVATIWLSLGMVSTGALQLLRVKPNSGQTSPGGVDSMIHLGYPMYLLTILGVWKIMGVVALLFPKFPLLKEWAYAGFFFVTTGAIFSHLAVADPISESFPSWLLLIMTLLSWYFRPPDRKIIFVNQ